jgi:hypothetical protein
MQWDRLVVAEHRRNSYATETLHLSVILRRAGGTERVLVACDHGDVGSTDEMRRSARIGRFSHSDTAKAALLDRLNSHQAPVKVPSWSTAWPPPVVVSTGA